MSTRPARKFDTVNIDPSKRDKLLRDISIYLETGRQKWYSDRGIPYKRSFLFHGPFGVGKSTVASTIAGELGLDIYTLSLRSGDITEAELVLLLSTTPRPCLIVLEDIDEAGFDQRRPVAGKTSCGTLHIPESGISLSGFLNATDGANAPEGRVLITSTNYYNRLDEAIKRPGRMDVHLHFDLASREDVKSIFKRIYQRTQPRERADCMAEFDAKSIMEFADEFSSRVPERQLSHAEIQEYLIQRSHSPQAALGEFDLWLKSRAGRGKKRKEQQAVQKIPEGAASACTFNQRMKLRTRGARSQNDLPRESKRLRR